MNAIRGWLRGWFNRYLDVPAEDAIIRQRHRSFLILLLIIAGASVVGVFQVLIFYPHLESMILMVFATVLIVVLAWFTRRQHHWPPYVFLIFLMFVIHYQFGWAINSPFALLFALPVISAPLIAPPWTALFVAGIEALILYVIGGEDALGLLPLMILGILGGVAWISSASLVQSVTQAHENAESLAESNEELLERQEELRQRTAELERRTRYMQATVTVARAAASVLDVQELLTRVVNLVSEQFGFYHAGLFLIDRGGEWAVLQAASSAGGQRMLARGHRLRVGAQGTVGYVTKHGEARIALDVGEDAVFFDNPDLPNTHSAVTLPLRARGEIIGALDVQSGEPAAFTQEEAAVLQALADQVALAISNARLFAQAQESLEAERRAYGEMGREAWTELLQLRRELAYRGDEEGVAAAEDDWRPETKRAWQEAAVTVHQDEGTGEASLAVPIQASGRVIGVIDTYKPAGAGDWSREEIRLVENLAEQLSVALESARFYEDIQRRAARERLTREITDHIRQASDIETLIKTTVQEITDVLQTSSTFVKLHPSEETPEETPAASDAPDAAIPREEL
ncbi:MAG: GAF domain-containing protein [Anaerolineales bacterium]